MVRKKAAGTDGFVRRLNQACDDVPHIIPPHGEGRQIELAKRLGMSQEGVRKWFAGEAMPRREAMQKLARLLEVEEPWLALGIMPELSREEKRINARNIDGAVLLAMGMISLGGGACALPSDDDPRRAYVDFYAILRGTQMAIHICYARTLGPGSWEVIVPREYKDVRTLVIIPTSAVRYDLIDLDHINTPQYLQKKGGAFSLTFSKVEGQSGVYSRGDMKWKRLTNVGELA